MSLNFIYYQLSRTNTLMGLVLIINKFISYNKKIKNGNIKLRRNLLIDISAKKQDSPLFEAILAVKLRDLRILSVKFNIWSRLWTIKLRLAESVIVLVLFLKLRQQKDLKLNSQSFII